MKHDWDPSRLDVRAFAQALGHLHGQTPLSQWTRLAQDATDAHAHVSWSIVGSTRTVTGGVDQVWLKIEAALDIGLICQRCLGPVTCPLHVVREFRFVATEALAAEEDETSDEDVLVWSQRFDVLELLEDELIMALPMIPMHESCQGEQVLTLKDEDEPQGERVNPFAVLSALRKDKTE